jgi:hypothetical protein
VKRKTAGEQKLEKLETQGLSNSKAEYKTASASSTE